jgi:hypothetical protein
MLSRTLIGFVIATTWLLAESPKAQALWYLHELPIPAGYVVDWTNIHRVEFHYYTVEYQVPQQVLQPVSGAPRPVPGAVDLEAYPWTHYQHCYTGEQITRAIYELTGKGYTARYVYGGKGFTAYAFIHPVGQPWNRHWAAVKVEVTGALLPGR